MINPNHLQDNITNFARCSDFFGVTTQIDNLNIDIYIFCVLIAQISATMAYTLVIT